MTQVTGNVTATHLTYGYELIPNGGFETGDLTGWSVSTPYDGATVTVETGHYAKLVATTGLSQPCFVDISQSGLDLRTATSISLDYKIATSTGAGRDPDVYFDVYLFYKSDESAVLLSLDDPATGDLTNVICELTDACKIESATLTIRAWAWGIPDNDPISEIEVWVDDIKTNNIVSSATIEDSSKTWTADQFNTDGMFILTSGDVKGYSCSITDTFENYIQVPTTFANIINNINSGTTYYSATEQLTNSGFETGDFTGYYDINIDEVDESYAFSTGGITSATKYVGNYGFWYNAWCEGYPHSVGFLFAATVVDITEITKITYWYNIPNIVQADEVFFRACAYTGNYGDGNVIAIENKHNEVTEGWVQGCLDVATLLGPATLYFDACVPKANW
jgi:hypothetical protein